MYQLYQMQVISQYKILELFLGANYDNTHNRIVT
jgi:hypothetical protein